MPAGLNNETLLLQRIDRQNHIISLLQQENTCFRQIIQAYVLNEVAASHSERASIEALLEDSRFNTSFANRSEGISSSNTALAHLTEGKSESNTFLRDNTEGKGSKNSIHRNNSDGKSKSESFHRGSGEGNSGTYLAAVAAQVRPFMKYATQLSLVNTALILSHLHSDPATPLQSLRKLTGLSEGGMAKRIMALKKAGLIVRRSQPLRYVLTDRGKSLLE